MVKPESHQVGEGTNDEQNRVASGLELVQQLAGEDWENIPAVEPAVLPNPIRDATARFGNMSEAVE